jgi:hypothetical protein
MFRSATRGAIWGALIGMVGTFVIMLLVSIQLDVIYNGGPGAGALVFYLSWILSPVAGVLGAFLGARRGQQGSTPP